MLVEVWDMPCKHIDPGVQLKSSQSSGRGLPGKPKAGGEAEQRQREGGNTCEAIWSRCGAEH